MRKRARRFTAGVLVLCLCFALPASASAGVFRPGSEAEARRQALSLFAFCAFHPEYSASDSPARLTRWENEITLWVGGSPTPEDLETLTAFLSELGEKVPGLPPVRRVRMDTDAAVRVWFVPDRMLPYYIEDYTGDNWGFFHYDYRRFVICSARIGIASDVTDQAERNHLILEELTGALGLPGDHDVYEDSILYQGWTTVQQLSDVDWRMLNLLYSPLLVPGMTEQEALDALNSEPAD